MTVVFGIIIVFASVIVGFLLAKGNLAVLFQPSEFLIIVGAAVGAFFIGTPGSVIKRVGSGLKSGFTRKKGNAIFLNLLQVIFDLANLARKEGILSIEQHVDHAESSKIFARFDKDKKLVEYICDSMRLVLIGIEQSDLVEMLEVDLETRETESLEPHSALSTIAESLPGLGIVAAVLGIIITMNSIGGDSAEVGKHVAAALVGTFLGVLLCYGLVGPLARVVKFEMHHEITLLKVAKIGIVGLSLGSSPMIVCEAARRAIPENNRPEFKEMEDMLRQKAPA